MGWRVEGGGWRGGGRERERKREALVQVSCYKCPKYTLNFNYITKQCNNAPPPLERGGRVL